MAWPCAVRRRTALAREGRRARGRRARGLRAPFAPLLVELLADALALELRQVVDEELAVEMVHLVLQADGQHAVELALDDGAAGVLVAHAHALGAWHVVIDAGHRQAAFLAGRLAAELEDLGVDEDLAPVLVLGHVDDHQALVPVDLRGRKADARGGIHGLEEVVDARFERRVEDGHRARLGAQPRVRIFEDGEQCHGVSRLENAANVRPNVRSRQGIFQPAVMESTNLGLAGCEAGYFQFITAVSRTPGSARATGVEDGLDSSTCPG
jgi:hypothetical protein